MPESDGDSQILDYEVWWDDGAEDANYDIIGTSTGNGLTFTTSSTLIAGNTYSFLIRAKNLVGDGAYSDILTIIAGTIPSKTPTPEKYSASINSIEIRWDAPSNGGSEITDYKVFWDSGTGNEQYLYKGNTAGYLTFTVPLSGDTETLIPGRAYEFKVSALNAVGEGE